MRFSGSTIPQWRDIGRGHIRVTIPPNIPGKVRYYDVSARSHPHLSPDKLAQECVNSVRHILKQPAFRHGFNDAFISKDGAKVDGHTFAFNDHRMGSTLSDSVSHLLHPQAPDSFKKKKHSTHHFWKDGFGIKHDPQAQRLTGDTPYFVKTAGSMLNPSRWPQMFRSLLSGHPERTHSVKSIFTEASGGVVIVVDGIDDALGALQGSGVPQKLLAILQALAYPMFLPLIAMGYDGAREERQEASQQHHAHTHASKARQQHIIELLLQEFILTDRLHALIAQPRITTRELHELAGILQALKDEHQARLDGNPGTGIPKDVLDSAVKKTGSKRGRMRALSTLLAQSNTPESANQRSRLLHLLMEEKRTRDLDLAPKLRRYFTSLAIAGTGLMWWSIAGYEAATLSKLAENHAAEKAFTHAAEYLLPIGQAAMAGYGVFNSVQGSLLTHQLRKRIKEARTTPLLANNAEVRRVLIAILKGELRNHVSGKIIAGGLLASGQSMMILGGPIVGFGTPILVAGAVITGLAVGLRASEDIRAAKRYGFDERVILQGPIAEALTHLAEPDGIQKSIEELIALRKPVATQLAWMKLVKISRQLHIKYPTLNEDEHCEKLKILAERTYNRPHQEELREILRALTQDHNRLSEIFKATGSSAETVALTGRITHAIQHEENPDQVLNQRAPDCTADRLTLLLGRLKREGAYNEAMRLTVKQLVVKHGQKFQDFLHSEKIIKQSKFSLPLLPWHIPTWKKEKTAYALDLDKLLHFIRESPHDPIAKQMCSIVEKSCESAMWTTWKYQLRSHFIANSTAISITVQQHTMILKHNNGGIQ